MKAWLLWQTPWGDMWYRFVIEALIGALIGVYLQCAGVRWYWRLVTLFFTGMLLAYLGWTYL